jgi:surface antigen
VLQAELDHARSDAALAVVPSLHAGDLGAPRLATEDEQTAMLLALADVLGDYDSTTVAPLHGIAGGNTGIVQLLPSVPATQLHAAYVAGDASAATLVADDRQQFEAAAQELATSLTASHGDVVASYAAYVRTNKLPPFVATWPDEERSSEWLQLWGSETGDIYGHRGTVPTATLLAYAAAQYTQFLTAPAMPLDQRGSAPPPLVPAVYTGTLPPQLGDFRAHAIGGGPLGPLPRLFADVPPGGFQPNRGWPVTECVWWASYNYPTAGVDPAPGHGWDAAEWWATFAGERPEGQVPQVGDVAVWGPSPASPVGHVAVVIAVAQDATTFVVSEMNVVQPGSGIVDDRLVRTGSPFLRGFVVRPAPTATPSEGRHTHEHDDTAPHDGPRHPHLAPEERRPRAEVHDRRARARRGRRDPHPRRRVAAGAGGRRPGGPVCPAALPGSRGIRRLHLAAGHHRPHPDPVVRHVPRHGHARGHGCDRDGG